ncbi:MAG: glycosyltransferase [Chloroflexales bacterium]|nr:glycosyltransferase [Chloroflexales bacterium]
MSEFRIPVMQLVDGFATEEKSGGSAQTGIQIALALDRSRYAPFVCGLWRYDTASERRWRRMLHHEGVGTAILIERASRIERDMARAAAHLWQVLHRVQPRIIHSHFERGDLLGFLSKIWHPRHPQIVRTMHTDQQWQNRPWLGWLLNLVAFPFGFDAEVAISQATKGNMDRRLAIRLGRRPATVIYPGISHTLLEQPAAPHRSETNSPKRAPRLAIVGRLERQKGHIYLLQAAVDVLRQFPSAEFWVIGAGILQDELERCAAELGVAHAVHFLGQRGDVPDLLRQTDVFVSASLWEGFPAVILEAMAMHRPVVATDVSGSRELVRHGETGLLVPAANPAQLAQAMRQMLSNPDAAQRMAAQARRSVDCYTIEAMAAKYDQLYQDVLGLSPDGS